MKNFASDQRRRKEAEKERGQVGRNEEDGDGEGGREGGREGGSSLFVAEARELRSRSVLPVMIEEWIQVELWKRTTGSYIRARKNVCMA